MLTISSAVPVYLATGPTDMRKSFDGLFAVIDQVIGDDPFSGGLFVFRNRRGDRVKILVWDRDGFVIYYKRLERGTFEWPGTTVEGRVEISATDLTLLLAGIELTSVRRRRRYQRAVSRARA